MNSRSDAPSASASALEIPCARIQINKRTVERMHYATQHGRSSHTLHAAHIRQQRRLDPSPWRIRKPEEPALPPSEGDDATNLRPAGTCYWMRILMHSLAIALAISIKILIISARRTYETITERGFCCSAFEPAASPYFLNASLQGPGAAKSKIPHNPVQSLSLTPMFWQYSNLA